MINIYNEDSQTFNGSIQNIHITQHTYTVSLTQNSGGDKLKMN